MPTTRKLRCHADTKKIQLYIHITLIQVYGPTTAATEEEILPRLVSTIEQVPKGDVLAVLLVMDDFNDKVGRKQPSATSSAVGLYGLGEMNEADEHCKATFLLVYCCTYRLIIVPMNRPNCRLLL